MPHWIFLLLLFGLKRSLCICYFYVTNFTMIFFLFSVFLEIIFFLIYLFIYLFFLPFSFIIFSSIFFLLYPFIGIVLIFSYLVFIFVMHFVSCFWLKALNRTKSRACAFLISLAANSSASSSDNIFSTVASYHIPSVGQTALHLAPTKRSSSSRGSKIVIF